MGHLSKTAKEPQIKTAFEDYGQVKSVDVSAISITFRVLLDCWTNLGGCCSRVCLCGDGAS